MAIAWTSSGLLLAVTLLLCLEIYQVDTTCTAIPKGFVSITDVAPTILRELRYAGFHNFVGRPITGYIDPLCILTEQAAKAMASAQADFMAMSPPYTIKVYDCYRPQMAVDDFVRWSQNPNDTRMKGEFYPTLNKSELFPQGYIAKLSSHSRGSTSDFTIVPYPPPPEEKYYPGQKLLPCFNPFPDRFHDNSLDMGTGFDCFSPISHTNSSKVTKEQMQHRMLFKAVMDKHSFTNYPNEWWHYTLNNEPFPDTYFNFSVKCH